MSERELLEHILYELQLANWQRAGGKKSGVEAPTPPDRPDTTTARNFGGKVVHTFGVVDYDAVTQELKRQDDV